MAVPFPLFTKVTPLGRAPVILKLGAGNPLAVTIKVPAVPTTNVVDAALVIAGASFTVRMNVWVAGGLSPLVAVIVRGYTPPVPAAPPPARVAVPSPLSVKLTPPGSAPLTLNLGAGNPVVVTVKLFGAPTVNVVDAALVIVGAEPATGSVAPIAQAAAVDGEGLGTPRWSLAAPPHTTT